MKTLTKKLWITILAFTLTLCTAFGVILTMPLAKADDSAAEPPDFSTWFAEPLEVGDVVAEQYIRVNNVSEVPEDVSLDLPNMIIYIYNSSNQVWLNTPDEGEDADYLPIVATYEDSFVFYVELFSQTWPEYDNLTLSISSGDYLLFANGDSPYPDGFLEHFEILSEPPVSGLASKVLEVGDDLAGKWVYMPNGAMADVVLSKTLSIGQGEDEPLEVDFFLGFYGNPGDEPSEAVDGCPCSWGFAELGIEVLTDGSKAYYKIPETFTLTHDNEFAINETEEFVAGDLVVKRIDGPDDGPQLMLFYEAPAVDDETPDNPGEDVTPDNPTDEQPNGSENGDTKTNEINYFSIVLIFILGVLLLKFFTFVFKQRKRK